MVAYVSRVVDRELDELVPGLAALTIEGPKSVGKTVTASRRAATVFAMDSPEDREILLADPGRLDTAPTPILIDEWQREPAVWDMVRRSVDRDPSPGRFILAGSATPVEAPTHTGAGRIVRVRMRPMSLAERGLVTPTVSLGALLAGSGGAGSGGAGRGGAGSVEVGGDCPLVLADYTEEIVASGFPAIRPLTGRARRAQLDGYLARIVEHDFPEQGRLVRRPDTLRAWLSAYAAATATTASYDAILAAATPGEANKPAKTTTIGYRDVLSQLYLLDSVPGWLPTHVELQRLGTAPKHHLADPALAARLLGADAPALIENTVDGPPIPRHASLLGALFESLVTLSVRAYAQAAEASVHHLRTQGGDHEVDLIVERADHRVVAIEVKLTRTANDDDVTHLRWLRERIGDRLVDAAVVTTGARAYRRADGIAVIPAGLLGP